MRAIYVSGLSLVFMASSHAVNFTRDAGDTRWSNLGQWNDNSSGSYQDSANFPTSSDTVLLNAGRVLTVDTNAAINIMVAPNAPSDAFVEFALGGMLTVNSFRVGNSSQAGNGTVNQSIGSLVATTLSLRPTATNTGIFNLSGGTVSATNLEIGNSAGSATGTSTFVLSGGSVTSPNITIGGAGTGTCKLSGGALTTTGTLDLNGLGLLKVVGHEATIEAGNLQTQTGSELAFELNGFGISTVQVSGFMILADASINVSGSTYYSVTPTNLVLMDSASLISMVNTGNVSITGLADASVVQVGSSVVLAIAESQTPVVFQDTIGDGLWGTAGNWSSATVPAGTVNALIGDGLVATIATNPPVVNIATVGSNATLVIQSEFSASAFHIGTEGPGMLSIDGSSATIINGSDLTVGSQGTLEFDFGMVGVTPLTLTRSATLDPAAQLMIDGTLYEGFDGYFPLILSSNVLSITTNVTFIGFGDREPALVAQSDGLWLRLIAPASLSQRLCSLVPPSTVAADYSNTVFSFTREYDPSGSAWSLSLSEAHVMDTRLSQEVLSGPGTTNQSWDLRVARGGNVYSLRTPALGETVPPSWRSSGDTSPWNDEVWQAVAVDTSQNDPANGSPYFMHQSGVYQKDPILTKPFYSPQLAAHVNEAERSFTTINWTPQAHINIYVDGNPTNDFKSYLLMFTRYRDLGQGVIEVTQGDYNYGPDTLDFLNMPWGGVRRTSTEYAFLSDPGGTTWSAPLTNGFGPVTHHFNNTGGWMGFSATSNGITPALGFVFGQDHATPLPNQNRSYSTFRPGYAGGAFQPEETTWRNYFVTSCIRWYNLTEGNGFWSRYYFVLGDDMTDLATRIADRNLVDAQLLEMNYTESGTPLVAYSFTGTGATFRVTENSHTPQFFLYAHPVNGSSPVFEIIEGDESRYLTWNPYANGIVKPYDGTISGMGLLGFAMPASGTNGTYAALASLLPAANYMPDGRTLFARTATPIETWRVEHFGFTEDAGEGANIANPDGDLGSNLYEYGLGGDPTNGADIGYLPTYGTDADGGTNFFDYVHARRTTPGNGLTYSLEQDKDLINPPIWTNSGGYVISGIDPLVSDPDFEIVTNRFDMTGKTNEFIRLKIEL